MLVPRGETTVSNYNDETLNHYGIAKTASDELSNLRKALAAAKKDKWLDAMKIMNVMERKWRKDRDVSALLANFFHHAEEHGYADDDKHGKAALKILEKMEAAFSAGYPNMAGVKVLRSRIHASQNASFNDDILTHYGIAKTASRDAFQQELISLGINPRSAAAITEMVAASRAFQSKTASDGLPSGFIKDAEYMLCAGLKKHFGKGTKKDAEPDEGDNEEALEHEDDEDKESELKLGRQTTKLAYALAKHYGADEVQALTASMYAYTKLPPKPRAKTAKVEFKQTGEMLRLWVTQAGQGSMKAAEAPGKSNVFSKKVSDALSASGLFLRFKLNDVWVESVGRGGLAFSVSVDAKLQEGIDVWDRTNLKALKNAFKAQGIAF